MKPVPGAIVRIQITTSKPVTAATAELLGPVLPDLACRSGFPVGPVHLGYLLESQRLQGWTPLSAGPLFLLERIPLPLSDDGMEAQATFSLPVNASAYRIVTTDEHGLTNRPIPRRAITFHPDDLPQVTLLPERFAESNDPADEIDLEGMPVPLGRSIRIGYLVQDDLALDRAVLQFRINEGDWQSLPLTEVKASQPLDERTGAAKNSSSRDQLPFHTAPPSNAASQLGRTTGGGRFDFQTRTLPQLRLGDIIDYRLEVYDRHDDPLRPPGRWVLRRKTVVTEAQFLDWL
ncbi:MAG TPA: hypothetical protein PKA06_14115, partial [Gemmatales bacterium]|nr:hypothetical protein [Gemmatales bacterium]